MQHTRKINMPGLYFPTGSSAELDSPMRTERIGAVMVTGHDHGTRDAVGCEVHGVECETFASLRHGEGFE